MPDLDTTACVHLQYDASIWRLVPSEVKSSVLAAEEESAFRCCSAAGSSLFHRRHLLSPA